MGGVDELGRGCGRRDQPTGDRWHRPLDLGITLSQPPPEVRREPFSEIGGESRSGDQPEDDTRGRLGRVMPIPLAYCVALGCDAMPSP
jgi:hypothetical protein